MQKEQYPIEGMMCASCAVAVEKVLQQAKGVKEASVNYANGKATITFDTSITSAEVLKHQVEEAGYGLVITPVNQEILQQREEEHYKALQRTFWGSVCCSLPVFLISMFHLHFP